MQCYEITSPPRGIGIHSEQQDIFDSVYALRRLQPLIYSDTDCTGAILSVDHEHKRDESCSAETHKRHINMRSFSLGHAGTPFAQFPQRLPCRRNGIQRITYGSLDPNRHRGCRRRAGVRNVITCAASAVLSGDDFEDFQLNGTNTIISRPEALPPPPRSSNLLDVLPYLCKLALFDR